MKDRTFQEQNSYSWTSLRDVYRNKKLSTRLQNLEESFHSADETQSFSALVNASTSRKYPYHRWIRYREGYAGELVKEILHRYPPPDQSIVLDPMCGSGSTLVACNESGIPSIGIDVSPFAVAASACKGYSLSYSQIESLREKAKKVVEESRDNDAILSNYDIDIAKFFNKRNLQQLVNLKRTIRTHRMSVVKDILEFALLAILEDCSDRKKDGNGLASRKTLITDCYEAFLSKVEMMAIDYQYAAHSHLSKALVHDAKSLDSEFITQELDGREVGSIVFSPPYANSFDYFASYKLELIFMEWTDSKTIHEERKALIRNYRLGYKQDLESDLPEVEMICDEMQERIPEKEERTGIRDGRTRLVPNMLRGYFQDMGKVIETGMQRLCTGGHMHIVVDQSAYLGVPIPTDILLAMIAERLGYEVVEITQCRKANTSSQQLKLFPYLSKLLRETIVTIHKP
jgi:hypothetical protein